MTENKNEDKPEAEASNVPQAEGTSEVPQTQTTGDVPAVVSFDDELAADGATFKETMSKEDMSIPFLQILQSLSPQCVKGKPEYMKEADPSDLYNTVSQSLYKTMDKDDKPIIGARLLPIHYKRSFIEWVPRSAGGGLVKEWDVADGLNAKTIRNESNQDIIIEGSPVGTPGNQINDTHTHFMFMIADDGSYEPVVLTMASTQVKPSKDLNNMVSKHVHPDSGAKLARFFGVYSATTQQRTNDQGSWYVWKFEKVSDVIELGEKGMAMYRDAKSFVEGITAGEHKVDYSKLADENPSSDDAPANGEAAAGDSDIPF